jgi:hypothetical protein
VGGDTGLEACQQDCNGDFGGDAELDNCGVCGGIETDPENCDEGINSFSYNQSTAQAFYFIHYSYDLNGNPLAAGEDLIGAFKGGVCVGSQVASNEITIIPVMGDDGYEWTSGYLLSGDLPEFKIYDASEDKIYAALPSENYPFENNGMFQVLNMQSFILQSFALHEGANLISFYALPEDACIENVLLDISDVTTGVITEGMAAYNDDNFGWIGLLEEFSYNKGYWILTNEDANFNVYGNYSMDDVVYDLHAGANLISYPYPDFGDISASIPDDVEHLFFAILGEGIAAMNIDNIGWVGALTSFVGGSGYWVIVEEDLAFSFNSSDGMTRSIAVTYTEILPEGHEFRVAQSRQQAFYFVNEITLHEGEVEAGDWLLSYNGDVITGIRQWQGEMIDIPAMGVSGDDMTMGYFSKGDIPTFKLLKQSTGEMITLEGEVPKWTSTGIFVLNGLSEMQPIPDAFSLGNSYPNPFNTNMPVEVHLGISPSKVIISPVDCFKSLNVGISPLLK